MALNKDQGKIDRKERDLYSRTPHESEEKRGVFTKPVYDVSPSWRAGDSLAETLAEEYVEPKNRDGFFRKFFIGSIVFFCLAIITFVYVSYGGFNTVSSKNVDIIIKGPVAIGGGEELVFDLTLTNNNNVSLEGAEFLIEYPLGTREPANISIELRRGKVDIGSVESGQSVTKTVKAVLFGEKDDIKYIKVSVDYKVRGSNAKFTKEKSYQLSVSSSPVLFSVDYPKEVNSNQDMSLTVTLTSNSNTLIKNLLTKVDYPFGFTFTNATPKPSFDNNVWNIGDLNPKEKRIITINGKMTGQNDEEKTFRFNAGTSNPNDEKIIGVDFISKAETVLIQKPFFDIKLAINGDFSDNPVLQIGQPVTGDIVWTNNLPTSIQNASIDVTFAGNALNRSSVNSDQFGFYQSLVNKIIWDKRSAPVLSEIGPGETGSFNFNFSTLGISSQTLASLRNPEIYLNVNINASRLSGTQAGENIGKNFSQKIKVATNVNFNPRIMHSVGPFENKGSIPPKAEKETTYTVFWALSNAFNDLSNVSVSASLPPYVTFTDIKSPVTEKILYNKDTNKIVWSPGEIKAGVGTVSAPREVAFQVSFLPSLAQVGLSPDIINDMNFKGTDKFTGKDVTFVKDSLSTNIFTDPTFNDKDDLVVK
ncbi:hypothetical protein EXS61_01215 [Candidatus Parcubacteria bacterium]|nr:hypothetical protein [Candidatus Parcubacteria bacterium]